MDHSILTHQPENERQVRLTRLLLLQQWIMGRSIVANDCVCMHYMHNTSRFSLNDYKKWCMMYVPHLSKCLLLQVTFFKLNIILDNSRSLSNYASVPANSNLVNLNLRFCARKYSKCMKTWHEASTSGYCLWELKHKIQKWSILFPLSLESY